MKKCEGSSGILTVAGVLVAGGAGLVGAGGAVATVLGGSLAAEVTAVLLFTGGVGLIAIAVAIAGVYAYNYFKAANANRRCIGPRDKEGIGAIIGKSAFAPALI